jgi:hypothetical protein
VEELGILTIFTFTGLALSDQQSAFSSQELEARSQESGVKSQRSAYCLVPTAYCLIRGWQGEGYLLSSFYRAGALGTYVIITQQLTMSIKKFCPQTENCRIGREKHGGFIALGATQEKM